MTWWNWSGSETPGVKWNGMEPGVTSEYCARPLGSPTVGIYHCVNLSFHFFICFKRRFYIWHNWPHNRFASLSHNKMILNYYFFIVSVFNLTIFVLVSQHNETCECRNNQSHFWSPHYSWYVHLTASVIHQTKHSYIRKDFVFGHSVWVYAFLCLSFLWTHPQELLVEPLCVGEVGVCLLFLLTAHPQHWFNTLQFIRVEIRELRRPLSADQSLRGRRVLVKADESFLHF